MVRKWVFSTNNDHGQVNIVKLLLDMDLNIVMFLEGLQTEIDLKEEGAGTDQQDQLLHQVDQAAFLCHGHGATAVV